MIEKFNQYAKENSLDIEVSVVLNSNNNSSMNVDDYGSSIEHLLKKHSKKYDIYFYDNMYSPRYSPYFINLKDYLSRDHLSMYSSGIASQSCVFNGKWVGLVSYIFIFN